jgi:hypothetical protein
MMPVNRTAIKFTVFWDVLLCNQVDIDRGPYCLHHQDETSVNIYLITQQCTPEDSKLQSRRRENLKSHTEQ